MKKFYKPLFPIAGFVLLAATVLKGEPAAGSVPPPAPGEHRQPRDDMRENSKKLAKDLGLTAAQESQVQAIHAQTAEQLKAVRNDTSLNDDQKRAKARDLRKASEDQVRALLTPEQQKKMKELDSKGGRRGPGDRPGGKGKKSDN